MTQSMICPNCQTPMEYTGVKHISTYGGAAVSAPISWYKCQTCGGAFGLPTGNSSDLFFPTALTFQKYEELAHKTAVYPEGEMSMIYLALKLASEAGEVSGKFGKYLRGDYMGKPVEQFDNDIRAEVGDVIWYASELARRLGGFELVARENLAKLKKRKDEGKLLGDGDLR